MTILAGDVKLVASQVMSDIDEGGRCANFHGDRRRHKQLDLP